METVVFTYTAFTYYELDQKYPLLIGTWLKANGFNVHKQCSTDWVGLYSLRSLNNTEALLKNTTLDDLRTIVEYKLIHASFNHLTPEFRTANWNFFGKIIDGEKVNQLVNNSASPKPWSRPSPLVLPPTTGWTTRANAQTKLSKFVYLLGGPENPQLYPTLTLDSKSYMNNRWKVSQVNIDTNLKLAGQPVDNRKFDVPPQTVNANYTPPSLNQILHPAGILQSPYFDVQFDAAQYFGATGVHIGHEITHGFDNIGRNYDGDGKLNPWWSNATDTTTFKQKAQCFSDQNDKFVVNSEVTGDVLGNVNGELSLYLKKIQSQYAEGAGDKLFYLSFAQARCSKNTDARLNTHLTGPHPPDRFRVTGALQNDAEFARVFKCPTDSYLNPSNKCLLWE
ncbi:hypothetical protein DYB28_012805 [Aphanomyces astaci]|uniref:Peptidase M13 C-terminal domain-containing protein n=1 Tax=Aphanomyces astaci TaxID=112090 RepID=A0A9X8ECV6_APHAT|nr:hypothetical protein DYB28_012805 [Aphanomyces astaci]